MHTQQLARQQRELIKLTELIEYREVGHTRGSEGLERSAGEEESATFSGMAERAHTPRKMWGRTLQPWTRENELQVWDMELVRLCKPRKAMVAEERFAWNRITRGGPARCEVVGNDLP